MIVRFQLIVGKEAIEHNHACEIETEGDRVQQECLCVNGSFGISFYVLIDLMHSNKEACSRNHLKESNHVRVNIKNPLQCFYAMTTPKREQRLSRPCSGLHKRHSHVQSLHNARYFVLSLDQACRYRFIFQYVWHSSRNFEVLECKDPMSSKESPVSNELGDSLQPTP